MRVKEGFVLREMTEGIVVVPTGKLLGEFKGMIHLNRTGKFIWELLQNEISMEEIADKLVDQYHIEKEKAMQSTENFLVKLREVNILEE